MSTIKAIAIKNRSREAMQLIDNAQISVANGIAGDFRGSQQQRQITILGESAWQKACAEVDTDLPWTQMRHCYRLLGLVRRYGGGRVDAACGKALELDVVDVVRVDRMLQQALESGPPLPERPRAKVVHLRFARPASDFAVNKGRNDER